jgi:hypothetical protein
MTYIKNYESVVVCRLELNYLILCTFSASSDPNCSIVDASFTISADAKPLKKMRTQERTIIRPNY